MKKSLFLVIFVMVGVLFITGCGKDLSKYAGTYNLEYYKYVGDPDTSKTTDEEWTMVLEKDGTGKSNRDGSSFNIEWSVDGENVKITEKFGALTIDYTGTLTEGRLDVFNGEKTNDLTLEAVFNKAN